MLCKIVASERIRKSLENIKDGTNLYQPRPSNYSNHVTLLLIIVAFISYMHQQLLFN